MATSAKQVITDTNAIYKGESGVFADHPAMTPKYAQNKGQRDAEYRESMARMFLSIADDGDASKQKFLNNLPSGAVQDIASVLLGNSGNGGYIDFLLARIDESFQEKVQINEVLSDNYVAFFFGQAAPIFSFQGYLINSYQDDQRLGMHLAYQNLLRGSQLARQHALVRIRYDSVIVSGALMSMQQTISAENETAIAFSFQLLVKNFFVFEDPHITTKVLTAFNPAGSAFPDSVGVQNTNKIKTTTVVPNVSNAKESVVTQSDDTIRTSSLLGRISDATGEAAGIITDKLGNIPTGGGPIPF
jgi:hypothetical protein